jgi:hypothetical protein
MILLLAIVTCIVFKDMHTGKLKFAYLHPGKAKYTMFKHQ